VSIYRDRILNSYLILPVVNAPVQAHLKLLKPKKDGLLTAIIGFPNDIADGYIEDLDADSVSLNGIAPVSAKRIKDKWVFKFNAADLVSAPTDCNARNRKHSEIIHLTLQGAFGAQYDYGNLTFEAGDMVVIKKHK